MSTIELHPDQEAFCEACLRAFDIIYARLNEEEGDYPDRMVLPLSGWGGSGKTEVIGYVIRAYTEQLERRRESLLAMGYAAEEVSTPEPEETEARPADMGDVIFGDPTIQAGNIRRERRRERKADQRAAEAMKEAANMADFESSEELFEDFMEALSNG